MLHLAKLPGVAEAVGLAGKVPDVPGLQAVLEEAWRNGMKSVGCVVGSGAFSFTRVGQHKTNDFCMWLRSRS